MSNSANHSTWIQHWLQQMQAGNPAARDQLLRHCTARLEHLTHRMLRRFPRVQRWEQTGDVLQNVLLRLHRALASVPLETPRQFLALATTLIRRELLDLVRHYYGPQGHGARQESVHPQATVEHNPRHEPADATLDPGRLAVWSELHETIAALPEEEREVCELLWYHGLTQPEAATVLNLSERTVKRRWQTVRLKLYELLKDEPL